jgi:mRNA-degrading endonuclease RelE of RelBE toxin-antitoxin system
MASGAKGKGKSKAKTGRPAPGPGAQTFDAPLEELSRDQLSVFLYVALLPEETRGLVKDLGLGIPGFRTEALGDVERCDVLSDEIRAHPPSARPVLASLTRAFEAPPLAHLELGTEGAADLLAVGGGDAALALSLWRVLADRSPEVREQARPLLDELAAHYFGTPETGRGAPGEAPAEEEPSARAGRLEAALAESEKRRRETEEKAEGRVEEARRRGEEQREKLQGALREARARESQALEESARAREEAGDARRDLARSRAEIESLRASDAVAEAQRARGEARDLAGKVGALESRVERLRERERELEAELERERGARPAPGPEPRGDQPPPAAGELEGSEAETWLFPVYTREFYDSIEGWDRRVQRAAFKQAHLLALDHRHPSLRALPLEGLPGYYRVRVATDVRLIYRRPERQNVVEILSLIDREDLDRYIRQAKTRS